MRLLFTLFISLLFLPQLLIAAEKEFGGIGAQVVPVATGEVVVLQVVADSPARKAGLIPGDLIVRINNVPLNGLNFNEVTRKHLWGFVGESVHVSWLRPGETEEREADLVRMKINQKLLRHPDVKMIQPKK